MKSVLVEECAVIEPISYRVAPTPTRAVEHVFDSITDEIRLHDLREKWTICAGQRA
ncbi:hypothetical protein GFS60_08113 (plasmid) [Rhodococcus sp. WAY2]|nr:hypothetical protein GFS60_08113 [Rhodococcus sp. WAY2]